jgi:hypothetical protein
MLSVKYIIQTVSQILNVSRKNVILFVTVLLIDKCNVIIWTGYNYKTIISNLTGIYDVPYLPKYYMPPNKMTPQKNAHPNF